MSYRIRAIGLTAGVVALAIAGCGGGDGTQLGSNDLPPVEQREREDGDPEVQSTRETLVPQPGNFLTDPGAAQDAIDAITADLGPVLVTSVDLYDQYVIFEAQDPTEPENLDSYTFRDGELAPPDPVHVNNSILADLPNRLFSFADVNWGAVAGLAQTAVAELQIEDGVVSHLGAGRGSGGGDVRLSLSVSGPRRSGSVEATADGAVVSAQLY
jgi:hypothetical protein